MDAQGGYWLPLVIVMHSKHFIIVIHVTIKTRRPAILNFDVNFDQFSLTHFPCFCFRSFHPLFTILICSAAKIEQRQKNDVKTIAHQVHTHVNLIVTNVYFGYSQNVNCDFRSIGNFPFNFSAFIDCDGHSFRSPSVGIRADACEWVYVLSSASKSSAYNWDEDRQKFICIVYCVAVIIAVIVTFCCALGLLVLWLPLSCVFAKKFT